LSRVVTYEVDDKTSVSFEIEPVPGWEPAASSAEIIAKVREAVVPAIEAAREVLAQAREMAPQRVEVKFGVKVTGTMNWLVAKAASEGNFEVTLAWDDSHPA
jgi:hypothetical protein